MAVARRPAKADISLALGSGQIMCSLHGDIDPVGVVGSSTYHGCPSLALGGHQKEDHIMTDALSTILETTEAERLATGFGFTEGPLWHPEGFYYFVDIRKSHLHRIFPGKEPELVRANTGEGNGTTFDLQGRVVICEGGNRRVTRWSSDGRSEVLVD